MHTLQTETKGAHIIPFTAETKCSGVDLKDGTQIRKGAFDAIRSLTQAAGHDFPRKRKMLFKTYQATEVLLWWSVSIRK